MLTISQLADYVGVTVRAVRHYHQRGLLAEPRRDVSGYRRYDAQAVIDLIRIKTLSDAGVPLARIEELLAAEPEQFARAVEQIDRDLTAKIRDLKEYRRRIAQLTGGEALYLPQEVVDFLDLLRSLGVSERSVELERDGWVMLAARYPEAVSHFIAEKRGYLDDPAFRRFYLVYDQTYDWDADDPRLDELADEMVTYFQRHVGESDRVHLESDPDPRIEESMVEALLAEHFSAVSPAWTRLNELARARFAAARTS